MIRNPALLALSLGSFSIGLTEFSPMGLLPAISDDLGVSIPTAGLAVTAYAFGVTLFAPLVTLGANRVARNRLLIRFFRMDPVEYRQFRQPFVANLSIIDVLMFNCVEQVQQMLTEYQLDKHPPQTEPGAMCRMAQYPDVVSTLSNRIAVE